MDHSVVMYIFHHGAKALFGLSLHIIDIHDNTQTHHIQ
jgi:hypothetical protein